MATVERVGVVKQRMVAALAAEGIVVSGKDVVIAEQAAESAAYLTLSLVLPHTAWARGDRIARELLSTLAKEDPTGPAIHLRSFETPEEAALSNELRNALKNGH